MADEAERRTIASSNSKQPVVVLPLRRFQNPIDAQAQAGLRLLSGRETAMHSTGATNIQYKNGRPLELGKTDFDLRADCQK